MLAHANWRLWGNLYEKGLRNNGTLRLERAHSRVGEAVTKQGEVHCLPSEKRRAITYVDSVKLFR